MEQMELRVLSSQINSNDNELVVEGLVNKTESLSHILGKHKRFREKIKKGAFQEAINESRRIDFLAEHKQDFLLATTENNSLELWEDEEGLKMRAKIAPTSYGKDFYTLMSEKLVSHMSFGFRVLKDSWKSGIDGIYERTVEKLELKEVSVVRNPAYPASAISARGIELVEDVEIPDEVRSEEVQEEKVEEVVVEEQPQETKPTVTMTIDSTEVAKQLFEMLKNEGMTFVGKESTQEQTEVEENSTQEEVQVEEEKTQEEQQTEVQETQEKIENDSETTQEKVEEGQKDNSEAILGLLHKYKELQKLK